MELKSKLEERLKLLESQKEQMIANLNALNGAIETLKDLLKDPEPTKE